MRTRFTATKEMAEHMLQVLARNHHKLSAGDFDVLFTFLQATKARLPSQETIALDLEKKARRGKHAAKHHG